MLGHRLLDRLVEQLHTRLCGGARVSEMGRVWKGGQTCGKVVWGERPVNLALPVTSRAARDDSASVLSQRAPRCHLEQCRLSRAARDDSAPRWSRGAPRLSRAFQVISRPSRVISSSQVISSGLRIYRAFQVISRPSRVISSSQVISRGLRISRALRISRGGLRDNSGLEMARSAQDDSVRSG